MHCAKRQPPHAPQNLFKNRAIAVQNLKVLNEPLESLCTFGKKLLLWLRKCSFSKHVGTVSAQQLLEKTLVMKVIK